MVVMLGTFIIEWRPGLHIGDFGNGASEISNNISYF